MKVYLDICCHKRPFDLMSILNPVELRRRGFAALVEKPGYVDALRFMLQYETGEPGRDYTRERQAILDTLTGEQILKMAREIAEAD